MPLPTGHEPQAHEDDEDTIPVSAREDPRARVRKDRKVPRVRKRMESFQIQNEWIQSVSRETKRLGDSISQSAEFSHFSETLGGLGTICSFEQTDRFMNEFET